MNRYRIAAIVASALGLSYGTAELLVKDVAENEGRRLTAYQDVAGIWTICDGHTGPDVRPGLTLTEDQCDTLLADDIIEHGTPVLKALEQPETGEVVAWIYHAFNAGVGATIGSAGMRLQREGMRADACGQFLRWTFITRAGKKLDCRDPVNRCSGLPAMRQRQYQRCMQNGTKLVAFYVD